MSTWEKQKRNREIILHVITAVEGEGLLVEWLSQKCFNYQRFNHIATECKESKKYTSRKFKENLKRIQEAEKEDG